MDTIWVIAMAAALIIVGAFVYGFMHEIIRMWRIDRQIRKSRTLCPISNLQAALPRQRHGQVTRRRHLPTPLPPKFIKSQERDRIDFEARKIVRRWVVDHCERAGISADHPAELTVYAQDYDLLDQDTRYRLRVQRGVSLVRGPHRVP